MIIANSKTNIITVKNDSVSATLARAKGYLNKALAYVTSGDVKNAAYMSDMAASVLSRAESKIDRYKVGDHVKIKDGASVKPQRNPKEYAGRSGRVSGYDKMMGDGHWATIKFDQPYKVPESKGGPFVIDKVQVHESDLKRD